MKQDDVVIGGVYRVRVSGRMARVRIDSFYASVMPGRKRRWIGTNLETGRKTTGTAARCRARVDTVASPIGTGKPA
jgi:hypothetical protein